MMHPTPSRRRLMAILCVYSPFLAALPSYAFAQDEDTAQDTGVQQLEDITIYGTVQSRYESRYADTAMRIPKDIAEVPRTIDVIPEQLLLDQQARELADAFRLSPNVLVADGYGGTREHTIIRGFSRNDNIYRNGVLFSHQSRIDPATIDNVQIIKGPVADIGRMSPGGLVNVETKAPNFQREHSASTTFDEHGQRRATLDLTGPVGDRDNLAYRVTGALEDSETFRDTTVDRQFLSSAINWTGSSGTNVNLNHEYARDRREVDRGLVTVSNGGSSRRIADTPRDIRFDRGIPNERDSEYHLIELDVSIPLSSTAWQVDNKLFYARETSEDIRAEVVNVSDSGELTRRVGANKDREIVTKFARSQLMGEIDAGIPIQLTTGIEYREEDHNWQFLNGGLQTGGTLTSPESFNIINDIDDPSSALFTDVTQKSYGIFSAADISLLDDLTMSLGVRYERFENDFFRENLINGDITTVDTTRVNKLTNGLGLVWQVIPELALYFNYADTFEPQNIYAGQQQVAELDPREGRQYEVGAKWSSPDNRYFITAAVFDIKEDNVMEYVDGEPVLTGGISSQGAELSVTANPVEGFNLRGNIGVVDAEVVSNDQSTDGNRPANIPTTTASLWASYEFLQSNNILQGLGIGSGITHASNRYGDNSHTFELGDYTVIDSGLWYYLPVGNNSRLRFDLGVKNVTDERYYVASGGNYRITPGDTRTFFAGARLEF